MEDFKAIDGERIRHYRARGGHGKSKGEDEKNDAACFCFSRTRDYTLEVIYDRAALCHESIALSQVRVQLTSPGR